MSGPFGSQQWMYSSGGFYPHEIGNSVRFDSNSQFTRTPSSSGNRRTFTFSAWVKRSKLTDSQFDGIFSAGTGGSNRDVLYFANNDQLYYNGYAGGYYWQYYTTQKFRDPSAWYHIVLAQDTTQATDSNRVKIYVNGEQITDFSTTQHPSLNTEGYINHTSEHTIGSTPYDTTYFDGYIAEVNFIDGQQLDPSYFGETKSDTWIPKKYTGSYGTNGYYLDFATRATDPIDASPNGNNWSSTNVVSTDWMPDSPTNNWATLNPIGPRRNGANFGTGTQTQGNLTVSSTSGAYFDDTESTLFNHGDSGKWYYEIRMDSLDFGSSSGYVQFNIGGAYIWRYYGNSNTLISTGGSFTSLANGDILMFAVDQDNGKGYFGVNGSWYNHSGAPDPAAGTNPHTTFTSLERIGQVQLRSGSAVNTVTINFGQDSSFAGQATAQGNTDANGRGDFYYSPPAGFLALCSANMPDPATAINPAENNSPQDHFNTVTYTGNGSSISVTGVGFQPDFVWLKNRANAYNNELYDVIRGAQNYLMSDHTNGAATLSTTLTSFDSDGFSYGSNAGGNAASGQVAWNWKAGGSGVSNTDGDITSTVSANTDAGFSIVTFTAVDGSSDVGHGLDKEPELLIHKGRDFSNGWYTFTKFIDGSVDYARLDTSTAFASSGTMTFNSTTFKDWYSSGDFVAYCFHSVEGFSKFGTYTGNGSEDGPFINCGFRPAFLMWKNTGASENWEIIDSARDPYNESYHFLRTNLSNAEASGTVDGMDILSNGFKPRVAGGGWINASGNTFIYMAFAEMPFKYANAR